MLPLTLAQVHQAAFQTATGRPAAQPADAAQASFGFVDDMRRKSSGAASASLMLSHWERLQVRLGACRHALPCMHLLASGSAACRCSIRMAAQRSGRARLAVPHPGMRLVQVDPFFVPVTEEQREEWGEEGQGIGSRNLARFLIDEVRHLCLAGLPGWLQQRTTPALWGLHRSSSSTVWQAPAAQLRVGAGAATKGARAQHKDRGVLHQAADEGAQGLTAASRLGRQTQTQRWCQTCSDAHRHTCVQTTSVLSEPSSLA